MKTRLTLAALLVTAGAVLSYAIDSDAKPEGAAEPGYLWCFSYPHYNVEAVTCVNLPMSPTQR